MAQELTIPLAMSLAMSLAVPLARLGRPQVNVCGMDSTKLVIPLNFISGKKTPNDAVTPQRQSQFTPKMKANAEPRLLSSLA